MSKSIRNIDSAKQKAINEIRGNISGMESEAIAILLKAIEAEFIINQGKIEQSASFVKQLNQLAENYLFQIQKNIRFTGPVSSLIRRHLPEISDSISEFQKNTNNIKVPQYSTIKKVIQAEIIDKMLDNGLNQHFVQPLRDLIFRNATAGLHLSEARQQIKEYIRGGKDKSGKLGQYMEQTAIQAVNSYSGMINKKLLEDFKYDGILIVGTIIDNSSPQCIFALEDLKGTITRKDWPKVKDKATDRFKLIEGTTFDNLPLNKLHWGCRHDFYPIVIKK